MTVPAHAIVVRGGVTPPPGRVRFLLDESLQRYGDAVLSVAVDVQKPGETKEEALLRICSVADIANGQILVSSGERIASTGATLTPDVTDGQAENHCHVVFDVPLDEAQIAAYEAAWDEPRPNPTGGKKRL